MRQGASTAIACMSANCDESALESFVLDHVHSPSSRHRYAVLAFHDHVRTHPQLRFCPGNSCKTVIKAEGKGAAKKCVCASCKLAFW